VEWEGSDAAGLLHSALMELFDPDFLLLVTVRIAGHLNPAAGHEERCILQDFPEFWTEMRGSTNQLLDERELYFYCILFFLYFQRKFKWSAWTAVLTSSVKMTLLHSF
jgi:hypothetical protein